MAVSRDAFLSLSRRTLEENKISSELQNANQAIAKLDREVSESLNQICCDPKGFAQLSLFLSSMPCTAVCQVPDDNGWQPHNAMMYYIRTLSEILWRTQEGYLRLFSDQEIQYLKLELQSAIGTFDSIQDWYKIQNAYGDWEKSKNSSFANRYKDAYQRSQENYTKKLLNKIDILPDGGGFCQAIGFQGHAMYVDFIKRRGIVEGAIGEWIEARLFNLGAASESHVRAAVIAENGTTIIPEHARNAPIYPCVFVFHLPEHAAELKKFCASISLTLTATESNAVNWLYLNNQAAKIQDPDWLRTNVTSEFLQTAKNCTIKNYLHSLRDRMFQAGENKDDDFYRRLIVALSVLSKNAHFISKNHRLPKMNDIVCENLKYLPRNELSFLGYDFYQLSAFAKTNISLAFPMVVKPKLMVSSYESYARRANENEISSLFSNMHVSRTRRFE